MPPKSKQAALQAIVWLVSAVVLAMALAPGAADFVRVNEKIQHMSVFGALTIAALLAYPRPKTRVILLGLVVFGALIEVLQMIPSVQRDADISDFVADCLAITAAWSVWKFWLYRITFASVGPDSGAKLCAETAPDYEER